VKLAASLSVAGADRYVRWQLNAIDAPGPHPNLDGRLSADELLFTADNARRRRCFLAPDEAFIGSIDALGVSARPTSRCSIVDLLTKK